MLVCLCACVLRIRKLQSQVHALFFFNPVNMTHRITDPPPDRQDREPNVDQRGKHHTGTCG